MLQLFTNRKKIILQTKKAAAKKITQKYRCTLLFYHVFIMKTFSKAYYKIFKKTFKKYIKSLYF